MKKLLKITAFLVVLILISAAVLVAALYRAAQQEPEFYAKALEIPAEQQAAAGDLLEKNVLDLHNEVQDTGQWSAEFSAEQINAWLATELPQKFPNSLPPEVSQPRVAINAEFAQIACHYDNDRFSAVISIDLAIMLTGESNQIAVRVKQLRAGALPIRAFEKWKENITEQAMRRNVSVKWESIDSDDVALIKLPQHFRKIENQQLVLESIEMRDGSIYISGRTEGGTETRPDPFFHTVSSENSAIQP